jgi:DNA (cytosine-5)-methyltransferase 1
VYGLDLFSGIGGITKALDGYVEPVAYCENDRYAQSVLLSRMSARDLPIAPIWDDVRTLNAKSIPKPEIIYGGFPCQDISVAGRGAGLAGKRSGLFFEVVRLVSEIRPAFVFLENVPAIRTRGADVVVGELARLRYDSRWITLSAAEIGANHRRERWWLLAHAKSAGPGRVECGNEARFAGTWSCRENVADAESHRFSELEDLRRSNQRVCTGQEFKSPIGGANVAVAALIPEREQADKAHAIARGGDARPEPSGGGWWATEPDVGRVAHGVPFRVDRLRALGNAVVPAQAREAFERLIGLK